LAAVCAAGGRLILQAVRLAARWPTCCLLAHGRPMGPTGVNGLAAGAGRPTGSSRVTCRKRNRSGIEIGRNTKYNTKLSLPPLPTYTSRIHTDTPTSPPQGCAMGPPMWPWHCGLTARPVSGVEWEDSQFGFKSGHSTSLCTHSFKFIVDYYTNRGSHVFVCFADFTKAFDRVNYWKLFNWLLEDGLSASVVSLLAYW